MESIGTVDEYGNVRYENENGEYHRTDGPAYETKDGCKEWRKNGLLHREDGPAYENPIGNFVYYYLNNIYYTSKEEWEQEVVKLKLGRIKDL
jgi:hypothetical protein